MNKCMNSDAFTKSRHQIYLSRLRSADTRKMYSAQLSPSRAWHVDNISPFKTRQSSTEGVQRGVHLPVVSRNDFPKPTWHDERHETPNCTSWNKHEPKTLSPPLPRTLSAASSLLSPPSVARQSSTTLHVSLARRCAR